MILQSETPTTDLTFVRKVSCHGKAGLAKRVATPIHKVNKTKY